MTRDRPHRVSGVEVTSPPGDEFWPAVRCGRCDKVLARLRDCGSAGVAVMTVERHGNVPKHDAETLNGLVFGEQRRQTELFRIIALDRRHRLAGGGHHPQSYAFRCGRRCDQSEVLVRVERLTEAAHAATRERRDVVLGVHL